MNCNGLCQTAHALRSKMNNSDVDCNNHCIGHSRVLHGRFLLLELRACALICSVLAESKTSCIRLELSEPRC